VKSWTGISDGKTIDYLSFCLKNSATVTFIYFLTYADNMRQRGRPKCLRRIEFDPNITYFKPRGIPISDLDVTILTLEELETLRLVDLNGLEQEQAAQKMGISRRAFWDELQKARKKVADALVNGKAIEIKGGNYVMAEKRKFKCYECQHEWKEPYGTGRPQKCPNCASMNIHRHPEDRDYGKAGHGGRGRCLRGGQKMPQGEDNDQ